MCTHRLVLKSNWPMWKRFLLPYTSVVNGYKIFRVNRIMYRVSFYDEEKALQNHGILKTKIQNYRFVAKRLHLHPDDFAFKIQENNKY